MSTDKTDPFEAAANVYSKLEVARITGRSKLNHDASFRAAVAAGIAGELEQMARCAGLELGAEVSGVDIFFVRAWLRSRAAELRGEA